ncbi:hypothetical protein [Streptococcus sp. sy010]|uniref:hypothetical protein n=1 Tax=Streptococcus sp. sy010 TaxID=2600148 RepID=UPI0011B3B82D|nr:hypothetical protein [Streptococcus sp. sy010]TWT16429.1 hypothetical protein FRX51_00510 [Streptococcus sp. sy010]
MIDLVFIFNGYRQVSLGTYETGDEAVRALKEHVMVNSAITNPTYQKSMSDNQIRIDYGARDCYYLIKEEEQYA